MASTKKTTPRTQPSETVAPTTNYVADDGSVVAVDPPVIDATEEEGATVLGDPSAGGSGLPRPWRTEIFGSDENGWGWRVVANDGITVEEGEPEHNTPLQAEKEAAKSDAGAQSSRIDTPRS